MPALLNVAPVHYADPGARWTACGSDPDYPRLVTAQREKVTCALCREKLAEFDVTAARPLSATEQARKLLDGVLERPLNDDQAMALAGLYIELAKAEALERGR